MELFKRFNETIFLKEDSDLEKQIKELEEIRPKLKYTNEIDKDILLLKKGLQGEKDIAFELKNSNLGMYVVHDVTIPFEDLKAQIDYVIVSRGFIYLVECKNLIGNITVSHTGEFVREYELNGKKYKEAIYSPYTQACRHMEVLKKRWISKNNKLMVKIQEKNFDTLWYKPLVVISNPKSIVNVKYAPREIKNHVVRVDQLLNYIKNDINNYDRDLLSNQKDMKSCADFFVETNTNEYTSIAKKYEKYISSSNINTSIEVEQVKEENEKSGNDKETLRNKLIELRTEKSKSMNVPAYYIFTNDELDKIIELNPTSTEELRNAKILSEIKFKLHSSDIIRVICEYNKR